MTQPICKFCKQPIRALKDHPGKYAHVKLDDYRKCKHPAEPAREEDKTKLKTCGFCGSEPFNMSFTLVRCSNNECPISSRCMTKKAWNTRTPDPPKSV